MVRSVLIGIDIGGTFTDAVAVRGGEVVASAKVPTEPSDLARSLLGALDVVLGSPGEVSRVSLSTTLITNLLAQGQVPSVATLLIPGPGLDPASYSLYGPAWTVKGAIDFRGRERCPLDRAEVSSVLDEIDAAGYRHLAIVGKFSPRNPSHEEQVAAWAAEAGTGKGWHVRTGHTVSGQLNFPRRAAATALTLAIEEPYRAFFDQLQEAFAARGLDCPTVILKADGGTLPLQSAERQPIQSIFSGPVASTMGALAMRPQGSTSVVVDVGGTTTDLALILDGEPLFSSRGGTLDGIYLPTRAFAVHSLPVGGDSTVAVQDGAAVLLPTRAGVAACLGGPQPTLTDALRLRGETEVGDIDRARIALDRVGGTAGMDAQEIAARVTEQAMSRIEQRIEHMFQTWQREPVYRIWELKQKGARRPDVVVGIGAAAGPLVPALGARMGCRVTIPPYAEVANALGAALARTTYTTTLHVDTERGLIEVAEEGVQEPLGTASYTLQQAQQRAREWMERRGRAMGIDDPLAHSEVVLAEQFNVVEGWYTVGRILDVRMERRCGLVSEWEH